MLGGAVNAHFRRSTEAGHRGGVDDGAATLGHQQRQLVLHAQPHAFDVDAHDGVELGFAAFVEAPLLDFDARVVEGVIQAAVGLDYAGHQRLHLSVAADIAAHEQRFAAGLTDQFDRLLATRHIDVRHHHLEAFAGKCLGGGATDSVSGARYQGDLTGETHAHDCVLICKWRTAGSLASPPAYRQHYQALG